MGSVYVLVNLSKGRLYVGSAKDWRVRLREHRAMLQGKRHPNRFLQNDWVKTSPEEWRFLILEDEIPEDLLLAHEQVYLSKVYDNQDRCYNIMPLARKNSLGVKRGQETKDRISRANSGKKRTLECRERLKKQRQILKGKKVWQYTLQGVLLGWFPGLREAARITGLKKPTIGLHLKNPKSTHAGGFLWTLDPEGKDIPEKVERYKKIHPPEPLLVVGYDPETGEVKVPETSLDKCRATILGFCDPKNTRLMTHQGLVWRRAGEPFDLEHYQAQILSRKEKMGFRGKHTEETKKKISKTKSVMSVEGFDPVTGDWSLRFSSVREASQRSGVTHDLIRNHCNDRVGSNTKKWRWSSI